MTFGPLLTESVVFTIDGNPYVLKEVRHSRIRDLLDERGELRISEINEALDVSEATVRRDLDEMASRGWIRRTHGGALRAERADPEPPLRLRQAANSGEKELIAKAAATFARSGETIFLGSGTTVAAMVPHLASLEDLRVVTNSLPVITQLAGREDVELIVVGGLFRHSEGSMVSSLADEALRQYRADHVFMGIRGINAIDGLTNSSISEAATDRMILQVASHRVILADHTKFGQVSTFVVGPVDQASVIVTSSMTDEVQLNELAACAVDIVKAEEVIA